MPQDTLFDIAVEACKGGVYEEIVKRAWKDVEQAGESDDEGIEDEEDILGDREDEDNEVKKTQPKVRTKHLKCCETSC